MEDFIYKTMLLYCFKCRKNPKVVKTKNRRIMALSNCAVCNSKKSKFAKDKKLVD